MRLQGSLGWLLSSLKSTHYNPRRTLSPGSYFYSWKAVTSQAGLFMDIHGSFHRAEITGEGRHAGFAACPGNTGVSLEISYHPANLKLEDLTDSDLNTVLMQLQDWLDL